MELVRGSYSLRPRHREVVATIGNFDGVHLGHQAMIERLRGRPDTLGLPVAVVTFEPPPLAYFAPGQAPARITRLRDKVRLLRGHGVDRLLCLRFGRQLADMEPEAFVEEVLLRRLGVRHLLVGDDFRFGRERRGDYALLEAMAAAHGFGLERMPTLAAAGECVSSTRIREALAAGDLDHAGEMLGGPYAISGRVVRGQALGRDLGYPTANIAFHGHPPPLRGVFAARVRLDGESWCAAASLGTRPTVTRVATLQWDRSVGQVQPSWLGIMLPAPMSAR
jgi:riboflavin kinase/FMN adenylyltransferase